MNILWHEPPLVAPYRPQGHQILRQVAEKHGLSVSDLKGRSRYRAVVWPRQEAMYELHTRTPLSLSQIARLVGVSDHTTVMHGIRRHAERVAQP